jgi:AraC-like DNA-binding protein
MASDLLGIGTSGVLAQQRLLQTTSNTIAEVAYSVGINDPFYFSKCFKNQFGVSPSAYRKKLSEDENEPINDADV